MTPRPFSKDPISISYSGWKRYKECPKKHYLVMTGQRPDKVNERNFLNGQVLHKVLERWFANGEPPSWIADQAEPVWNEYVDKKYIIFTSSGDRQELLEKCKAWGKHLAHQIETLGFDKTQCHSELNVERFYDIDGYRVRLHGYIDILVPTLSGDFVVMDLKCSANRSVMDPYQMVFYSLLLEDAGDRDAAFILPALDDIVSHTVTEEHRQWLLGDIGLQVRKMIADQFEPDPENANCHWCDVKHACPVMGGLTGKTGRVVL